MIHNRTKCLYRIYTSSCIEIDKFIFTCIGYWAHFALFSLSRLLNLDIDKWAHLNCALWSQEVYETQSGALMNVDQAFKRSLRQKCVVCAKLGASIGCFKQRCNNVYHVPCARLVGCIFFEDKVSDWLFLLHAEIWNLIAI